MAYQEESESQWAVESLLVLRTLRVHAKLQHLHFHEILTPLVLGSDSKMKLAGSDALQDRESYSSGSLVLPLAE